VHVLFAGKINLVAKRAAVVALMPHLDMQEPNRLEWYGGGEFAFLEGLRIYHSGGGAVCGLVPHGNPWKLDETGRTTAILSSSRDKRLLAKAKGSKSFSRVLWIARFYLFLECGLTNTPRLL